MAETTRTMGRRSALLLAAGAALGLPGCAATHVGEHWQCPLAQGAQCTSVAAADPAVPDAGDSARPAAPDRARDGASGGSAFRAARGVAGGCDDDCSPFAWLARLFGAGGETGAEAHGSGTDEAAVSGTRDDAAAAGPGSAAANGSPSAVPAPAPAQGALAADEVRAPETIGRVWIAPWVDDDGVYREASWVRIVLAPASWTRR